MRSSNSHSGVSSTGSTSSSQRSNQPTLLRLYSFGSQKLNQISGHFTPQIGQNASDESQCYIPSTILSPCMPTSFETIENHSENFKNPISKLKLKSKSTHLPLPKLLSKSTHKVKKALQDFQEKNPNCEKSTYPSFHQILSKTYPTVPQLNEVESNLKMNEETQMYQDPKPIRTKGLIQFDPNEFIEQRLKAKETLRLEEDVRFFELSVHQITRQRAKSEHNQSMMKKNERFHQETNKLRSSYEAHSNPSLKLNSLNQNQNQNHSDRSNSFEPARNEIFEPLALEITHQNPHLFVSHHQDEEITKNHAQEDGDDEVGDEDECSIYEVTPEQYDVKEELILPRWPNHLS